MAKTLWKRNPHRKAITGAVLIAACLLTAVQADDSPSGSHGKTKPLSNQQFQGLVADLGHSSYHRRETATKILATAGTRAVEPLLLAMSQQGPETVQRAQRILVQLVIDSEAVYLLLESMRDKNNQTARIAKKVTQTEAYQLAVRTRHLQRVQSQIRRAQQAVHSKQWKLAITRSITAETLAKKLGIFDECQPLIFEITVIVGLRDNTAPTKSPKLGGRQRLLVQRILRRARFSIKKSKYGEAHRYVLLAASIEVSYGLFDDYPKLVLSELTHARAESQQADVITAVKPLSHMLKAPGIWWRESKRKRPTTQPKSRQIMRISDTGK